jgi:hypothetical protein
MGESSESNAAPHGAGRASWAVVEAEWRLRKFDLWARWGDLTYEEVEMIDADRDRLAAALRARYGLTNDAAKAEIALWLRTLR